MSFIEITRENSSQILAQIHNPKYPSHFHKNVEILYPLNESVRVKLNNTEIVVEKDSLLFIDSYTVHHILGEGRSITICIPINYLDDYFEYKKHFLFSQFLLQDAKQIKELLLDLIEFHSHENQLIVKGKVNTLLGYITQMLPKTKVQNEEKGIVIKAIQFMQENYQNNLTLTTIAKGIGYSKHTLSHNFYSQTGLDIREYLTQIRLNAFCEKASKLDNISSEKLSNLIFSVGFRSVQTFYRVFKNKFQKTPKQFLQEK